MRRREKSSTNETEVQRALFHPSRHQRERQASDIVKQRSGFREWPASFSRNSTGGAFSSVAKNPLFSRGVDRGELACAMSDTRQFTAGVEVGEATRNAGNRWQLWWKEQMEGTLASPGWLGYLNLIKSDVLPLGVQFGMISRG